MGNGAMGKALGGEKAKGILLALLAACCYSVSSPLSKLLLGSLPPTLTAGFLYLGAGLCMLFIFLFRLLSGRGKGKERRLSRKDLPYVLGMVILDIAAPILMMLGLVRTSAANASLLNNFEIVATTLVAFFLFRERISPRLFLGIGTIALACLLLSFEGKESLGFSEGSIFILLAALCWGFENNCTRMISSSDPMEIVLIKGLCSGTGSLLIGLAAGERIGGGPIWPLFAALGVGVLAYGLSIFFYIYAQRFVGAAETSAFYAVNPFVAAAFSMILFLELPGPLYWAALLLMGVGAFLAAGDKPLFKKKDPLRLDEF